MERKLNTYRDTRLIDYARILANFGARKGVIRALTMLPKGMVASIHTETKSEHSNLGRLYTSIFKYFNNNNNKFIDATIFLNIYMALPKDEKEAFRFTDAYTAYALSKGCKDINDLEIHVDMAKVLVDWYQDNSLVFLKCSDCHSDYIDIMAEPNPSKLCPGCRMMSEHYCEVCGEPVEYKRGRKKLLEGTPKVYCKRHQRNRGQRQRLMRA
jgi:hypothetical protein